MKKKSWSMILEAMENINDDIETATNDETSDEDVMEQPLETNELDNTSENNNGCNETEILNELNKVFTPILVMQGLESNVSDEFKEACSEDNVLTEKNIIKFDDETRMAQLISVCALLIEKQKNTELFQTYQKAAIIKKNTKLEIQKQNYDEAKMLAQKYLVKVSTTNNSSVARQAANELLPETQH